jgi:hypothetical protein
LLPFAALRAAAESTARKSAIRLPKASAVAAWHLAPPVVAAMKMLWTDRGTAIGIGASTAIGMLTNFERSAGSLGLSCSWTSCVPSASLISWG